jgi:predicted Zn-dependent protease
MLTNKPVMKRNALLALILVAATVGFVRNTGAASAVVSDGNGHLVTARGLATKGIAVQRALATARQEYGASVRLIAASDVTGYNAIAAGERANGHGSLVVAALGQRTQAIADALAIRKLLKAGAVNPVVKWQWHG